ncbi:MAG: PP2C family protein-serine/threonine phosphatase [Candidatus Velthaea sp.]
MRYWIDCHPLDEPSSCGDFVECWNLAPYLHAIVIGDIAGRGIQAGEAAAVLHAHIRALMLHRSSLAAVCRIASRSFTDVLSKETTPFATLFIAVLDARSNVLRYASAGHEPGLLFSRDGSHQHLMPTGPVLGIGAIPMFRERVLQVQANDVLVLVTDGITEARRRAAERLDFFGNRGVAFAVHNAFRDGRDPAQAIYGAAREHADGHIADDASAIVSCIPARFPLQVAGARE